MSVLGPEGLPSFEASMAAPAPQLAHPADVGPLDSTDAFEGPEKLLEIWFAPTDRHATSDSKLGLKAVPEQKWYEMLDLVQCKVLSVIRSVQLDSYLLSESSMFVYPYRIVLKTCGTTTLLKGLWRILELAAEHATLPCQVVQVDNQTPVAVPYRVFYSRKSYLFPQHQPAPHQSWETEVSFLKKNLFGHAITIGDITEDPWYLFYTQPSTVKFPLVGFPQSSMPSSKAGSVISISAVEDLEDETIEVLMTDLHPDQANIFYGPDENNSRGVKIPTSGNEIEIAHQLGTQIADLCGLSSVYPKSRFPFAITDSYLFSPCGFSANGVIPVHGLSGDVVKTYYWTVHVTPQQRCSYASFETNMPVGISGHTIDQLVEQVVNIFGAGRFTVNRFEPPDSDVGLVAASSQPSRSGTGLQVSSMLTPKGLKRFFRLPIRRLLGRQSAGKHTETEKTDKDAVVADRASVKSGSFMNPTPRVKGYSMTSGSFHILPEYRLIFGTYARHVISAYTC